MSDGHFCIIRDLGPVKGRRRKPLQTLQTEISPQNAHNGPKTETKARGGVRTRSDGDPRQVRNSHQAVLTRE
jgi:hypothetical protein